MPAEANWVPKLAVYLLGRAHVTVLEDLVGIASDASQQKAR
jgi:hypothetical protein